MHWRFLELVVAKSNLSSTFYPFKLTKNKNLYSFQISYNTKFTQNLE